MSTPEQAEQSQWQNLATQSGKSREEWLALANAQGFAKHGELVSWLKSTCQLGHGYANLIAIRAREQQSGGPASGDDLLAAQYAGAKAALWPLYQQLCQFLQSLGDDVELSPKKSYVSVRRRKQFALLQPSTASRLDIGLNLKNVAPEGVLEASGSFNAMCSHRVRLQPDQPLPAELQQWLAAAYQQAG